jgi:D-xylose transport system permease protein
MKKPGKIKNQNKKIIKSFVDASRTEGGFSKEPLAAGGIFSRASIDIRMLTMVLILFGLWLMFRLLVGDFYFSGESIAKLSRDMVTWTILAAGMTLVIITGNIDLSVGSLLAMAAASGALLINSEYGFGLPAAIAVPAAILIGTAAGFLQGVLTAYVRIPAFIVTLGGLFIFRGITQKISAFDPAVPDSSWVSAVGFNYIPPLYGWILGIITCIIVTYFIFRSKIKKRKLGLPTGHFLIIPVKITIISGVILGFVYKLNQYKGIPYQTSIMIVILVLFFIVTKYTRFGRHLYSIGGNREAARLSGINVKRHIVAVFLLMGFLAGIAGIIWMAQNQGSTKSAGQFYELYAIAACVIGGTSLMGGRGSIFGTFIGALIMATVIQGMDYTNLDNWLQLVVRGGVLVIAVGIDIASKKPHMFKSFYQSRRKT